MKLRIARKMAKRGWLRCTPQQVARAEVSCRRGMVRAARPHVARPHVASAFSVIDKITRRIAALNEKLAAALGGKANGIGQMIASQYGGRTPAGWRVGQSDWRVRG